MIDEYQLELFKDMEAQPIYVKMVVTYTVPEHEGVPHVATHQFVDMLPKLEISVGLIDAYRDWDNVKIDVWHMDVPEPLRVTENHPGVSTLQ